MLPKMAVVKCTHVSSQTSYILLKPNYVTVTPDLRFEVSRRIREEFNNGKHYYALQGQKIFVPDNVGQRPDPGALNWHNEHCFKG
jgi:putative restriction endonuclease